MKSKLLSQIVFHDLVYFYLFSCNSPNFLSFSHFELSVKLPKPAMLSLSSVTCALAAFSMWSVSVSFPSFSCIKIQHRCCIHGGYLTLLLPWPPPTPLSPCLSELGVCRFLSSKARTKGSHLVILLSSTCPHSKSSVFPEWTLNDWVQLNSWYCLCVLLLDPLLFVDLSRVNGLCISTHV